MRKSLNPDIMRIGEVAEALDLSVPTIKRYRKNTASHPFFFKAFKTGGGSNSPLRWWRSDVDAYLRETTGRGLEVAA